MSASFVVPVGFDGVPPPDALLEPAGPGVAPLDPDFEPAGADDAPLLPAGLFPLLLQNFNRSYGAGPGSDNHRSLTIRLKGSAEIPYGAVVSPLLGHSVADA